MHTIAQVASEPNSTYLRAPLHDSITPAPAGERGLYFICLCTILRWWEFPPLKKGGQGGFVVCVTMKIPLGPPFPKGEVEPRNNRLRMVQRHVILWGTSNNAEHRNGAVPRLH